MRFSKEMKKVEDDLVEMYMARQKFYGVKRTPEKKIRAEVRRGLIEFEKTLPKGSKQMERT